MIFLFSFITFDIDQLVGIKNKKNKKKKTKKKKQKEEQEEIESGTISRTALVKTFTLTPRYDEERDMMRNRAIIGYQST